jgi:hypothetical protein
MYAILFITVFSSVHSAIPEDQSNSEPISIPSSSLDDQIDHDCASPGYPISTLIKTSLYFTYPRDLTKLNDLGSTVLEIAHQIHIEIDQKSTSVEPLYDFLLLPSIQTSMINPINRYYSIPFQYRI